MLQTETVSTSGTRSLPPELQSPRAKLVYLYLTTNDGATVAEMGESLGMTKLALYSVLKSLRQQGHVDHDREAYSLAGRS